MSRALQHDLLPPIGPTAPAAGSTLGTGEWTAERLWPGDLIRYDGSALEVVAIAVTPGLPIDITVRRTEGGAPFPLALRAGEVVRMAVRP